LADRPADTEPRVVSSDREELILVDDNDRETGFLPKGACHEGDGVLHRAFSIFIFDDQGRLLLQRRAPGKRLWPGFWSNSCCSHPRRGESMDEATRRRLDEELGLTTELEHLFTFSYHARYLDVGSEREVCWVFAGRSEGPPRPNPLEISEVRWIAPDELEAEMAASPERLTPWFKLEWPRVKAAVANDVSASRAPSLASD
jgi:isopentenyl-diphosphate delta-isomerase